MCIRDSLEPGRKLQEELKVKRALKEKQLTRQRKVAWFVLGCAAIGAGMTYFTGYRLYQGIIWGGALGALIGWLFTWRSAA